MCLLYFLLKLWKEVTWSDLTYNWWDKKDLEVIFIANYYSLLSSNEMTFRMLYLVFQVSKYWQNKGLSQCCPNCVFVSSKFFKMTKTTHRVKFSTWLTIKNCRDTKTFEHSWLRAKEQNCLSSHTIRTLNSLSKLSKSKVSLCILQTQKKIINFTSTFCTITSKTSFISSTVDNKAKHLKITDNFHVQNKTKFA